MRADPEPARRLMLRVLCAASIGLALAVACAGFWRGYELYDGGEVVGAAAVASSPPLLALIALALAALGGLVWRRPLLANALLWSMVSIGLSVFMLAFTRPPQFERSGEVTALPAASIGNQLLLALMIVQLAVLPIACALFALATRAPRPDRIARARVVRIGRR